MIVCIFSFLDPDCESGYGSRDPIESGYNQDPDADPDPQHCPQMALAYGLDAISQGPKTLEFQRPAPSHLPS